MSRDSTDQYLQRFEKVLEVIDANLEHPLSVESLSDVASFSKFHFHRQFSALFGCGVYEYVQRKRLKRASYTLAYRRQTRVVDIALQSGYESAGAFSRAFKKLHGQTPTEFRRQPDWAAWHAAYQALNVSRSYSMDSGRTTSSIEIVEFPKTRIAALEHADDPSLLGDSIRRFIDWRKRNGLPPSISATFNILYNDPAQVEPHEYRIDICAEVTDKIEPNDHGVVDKIIPAGRCARLRHTGSDNRLASSIHRLYAQWLPESGEALRDFPIFVQRVKFFPDVAENEAVTDIFLPLQAR